MQWVLMFSVHTEGQLLTSDSFHRAQRVSALEAPVALAGSMSAGETGKS